MGEEIDKFLGVEHSVILDELVTSLADLTSGKPGAKRVVLLEGPSGVGKSRIVRELYRRLASSQSVPRYWPDLTESDRQLGGSGLDPMPARKRLGPPTDQFRWLPDALPDFLWWPLDCSRFPSGVPVDVIAQVRPELEAHLVPAVLAWQRAASTGDLARKVSETLNAKVRGAIEDGAVEVAGTFLEAAGHTVPLLGTAISWLRSGSRSALEYRDDRRRLAQDNTLEVDRETPAVALADLIASLSHSAVPSVIVIEDAHLMPPELSLFLEAVVASAAPILVVATAWPEHSAKSDYGRWKTQGLSSESHRIARVPDMDSTDLAAIALRFAPGLSTADSEKLVTHYTNPLALKLFLSLGAIQQRIREEGGTLHLSDEDTSTYPPSIEALYRARWSELPPAVAHALSLAAASLGLERGHLSPFLPAVVADASAASSLLNVEQRVHFEGTLSSVARDHQWCDEIEGTVRFRELALANVARASALEAFSPAQLGMLRVQVVATLRAWLEAHCQDQFILESNDEVGKAAARWLWGLLEAPSTNHVADSIAALAVSADFAREFRVADALQTVESWSWSVALPKDHDDVIRATMAIANWLHDLGRSEEAIRLLRRFNRIVVKIEDGEERVLDPRAEVAWLLTELGRNGEALELIQQAIDERGISGAVRSKSSANVLRVRALILSRSGRYAEAQETLTEVIDGLEGRTEPLQDDVIAARMARASVIAEAGSPLVAIAEYENCLSIAEASGGLTVPELFVARNNLARLRGRAGDLAAANQDYDELVRDMIDTLGARHRLALSVRGNAAAFLGRTQDPAAASTFELLIADLALSLGPFDLQTLNARHNYASYLNSNGRRAEARSQYRRLIPEMDTHLGRDHPITQTARATAKETAGPARTKKKPKRNGPKRKRR